MKVQEIQTYLQAVNSLNSPSLSVENIKKLLKISEEMEDRLEKSQKIQQKIFENHKVKQGTPLEGHKEEEEIRRKITELLNEEVELTTTNFLTEDELLDSSKGMQILLIKSLKKLLCK